MNRVERRSRPRCAQTAGGGPGARDPGDELDLGTHIGRYVIVGWLGGGGMGLVYAAHDPELDRTIALKLLRRSRSRADAEAFARLLREAQLTARLSHPNVVAVYDVGTHESQVFVAMELVVGDTLSGWLRAETRDWRTIIDAFVQAGRGIAAAHAAGLIHRDIKPDNMLVGRDRRVRVSDFGLARAVSVTDDGQPLVTSTAAADHVMMTRTGAMLGTPAYMAPEQLAGSACDERSDQFSFCVALHEALYGKRSFIGKTVAELRAAMATPVVKRAPRTGSPAWIRRVVVRGLALDPTSRYPSMEGMLAALTAEPHVRVRRVGFALAFASAVGLIVHWQTADAADPCTDAPREIAEVWNGAVKSELGREFSRVSAPYAGDAWKRVEVTLDRYANTWAASHREACRATRIDAHQSEAALDLRISCLDRRKQELAAAAETLRNPTPEVALHAVALVQAMSSISSCSDLDALRAPVAPPRDFLTATKVLAIGAKLARSEALIRSAQLDRARPEVGLALASAKQLGYQPLLADAWLATANLDAALGDSTATEAALYEALWAAQASRHHRDEVLAWSKLLIEIGNTQARLADGLRMFRHAEAALTGYGHDAQLRGQILLGAGMLYRNQGDYAHAREMLERARSAMDTAQLSDLLDLGAVVHAIGTVELALGHDNEALARFQQSLEIRKRAVGDHHPDVGKALMNIGNVYKDRADYDRALTMYTAAQQVFRESLPATHSNNGEVEGNIGLVLMEQGHYDDALVHQHKALEILEASHGPDHPEVGLELNNIGLCLTYAKRPREALPYFDRARSLFVKASGSPRTGRGDAFRGCGRPNWIATALVYSWVGSA